MAWQGRFDDIGQYGEGDKTGKSFKNLADTSQRQNQRFNAVLTSTKHEVPISEEIKRLCDIKADTISVTVTGIIIAKEPQRSFLSKKNVGSERHLISFIVRDSPTYFVNVTCWGGFEFIHHIATSFKVGDIVQIKSAQVQAKASNQADEKFKPWTPVPFQLSVSENRGYIDSYAGWDIQSYRNFLTIPTRSSNNFYALEDINISGATLQGQHVNILAAIRKVGQVRFLTTKMGKQTKKCEIIMFDKTCPAFSLDLWDHHVDTAFQWIPYDTVIFAADIKITYNNFKSSLVASTDCKTIFTTNPDTREARCLRQFLRTQDAGLDIDFDLPMHDVDPDVNSISEVFTVQQVKIKQATLSRDSSTVPHYGVMFAVLTTFDIDGDVTPMIQALCVRCRRPIENSVQCSKPECATNLTGIVDPSSTVILEYNFTVGLSDHTGTISFCHLLSEVAESLVGCKPSVFMALSDEQRTQIKWQLLLERCKVIFKLRKFRSDKISAPLKILLLEKQVFTTSIPGKK